MFNPFFDTSSLSDKELLNKIDEMSARVVRARMSGINFEIIENMKIVILSCEEELRTRAGTKSLKEVLKDSPCIFESDRDYTKEANTDESTKKSISRPQW